jgi:hypothetical protein
MTEILYINISTPSVDERYRVSEVEHGHADGSTLILAGA